MSRDRVGQTPHAFDPPVFAVSSPILTASCKGPRPTGFTPSLESPPPVLASSQVPQGKGRERSPSWLIAWTWLHLSHCPSASRHWGRQDPEALGPAGWLGYSGTKQWLRTQTSVLASPLAYCVTLRHCLPALCPWLLWKVEIGNNCVYFFKSWEDEWLISVNGTEWVQMIAVTVICGYPWWAQVEHNTQSSGENLCFCELHQEVTVVTVMIPSTRCILLLTLTLHSNIFQVQWAFPALLQTPPFPNIFDCFFAHPAIPQHP
jgi:hypothetical protein